MGSIPVWLYQLLKLAISIGSPYLLNIVKDWVKKHLSPEILDIINEFIKAILDPTVSNREAKKIAKRKLKECTGVACPPETKRD